MSENNNENTKTTRRFKTFAQNLANADIDVIHKVREVELAPITGADSSFFLDTIIKWQELNCTAHFSSFRREVLPLCQTLPELFHHREKIVDILIKHMTVKDSLAIDVLLELTSMLARDLRTEFYPSFPKIFDALLSIFEPKNVTKTEKLFSTLSFLFKYLMKSMRDDLPTWFERYTTLLGHKQWFIRQFAAEIFSILVRKLSPDQIEEYLDKTFDFLRQHPLPYLFDGVALLMFNTMKGVKQQFHSRMSTTYSLLFKKLDWSTDSANSEDEQIEDLKHRYLAIYKCNELMCEYTTAKYTGEIWKILQEETDRLLNKFASTYKGEEPTAEFVALSDQIGNLMEIVALWTCGKFGKKIEGDLSEVFAIVESIINKDILALPQVHLRTKNNVLLLIESLLMVSRTKKKARLAAILDKVFEVNDAALVFKFFGKNQRHADVLLPFIFRYCDAKISTNTDAILRFLADNLDTFLRLPVGESESDNAAQRYSHFFSAGGKRIIFSSDGDVDTESITVKTLIQMVSKASKLLATIKPNSEDFKKLINMGNQLEEAHVVQEHDSDDESDDEDEETEEKDDGEVSTTGPNFAVSIGEDTFNALYVWSALRSLQKIEIVEKQRSSFSKMLTDLLKSLNKIISGTKPGEVGDVVLHIASETLMCLVSFFETYDFAKLTIKPENVKQSLFSEAMTLLRKFGSNLSVLKTVDYYFGVLGRYFGKQKHLFTKEVYTDLCIALSDNLQSQHQPIRLETLRILVTHFEPLQLLPSPDPKTELLHGDCEVLHACFSIESTPNDITEGRNKSMALNKIESLINSRRVPEVYLRLLSSYLLGALFIKFAIVWTPVSSALASLANNYFDIFWDSYWKFLRYVASQTSIEEVSTKKPSQKKDTIKKGKSKYFKNNKQLGAPIQFSDKKVSKLEEDIVEDPHNALRDKLLNELNEKASVPHTDYATFLSQLFKVCEKISQTSFEEKAKEMVGFFFSFLEQEYYPVYGRRDDVQPTSEKPSSKDNEQAITIDSRNLDAKLGSFLTVLALLRNPKKLDKDGERLKTIYLRFLEHPSPKLQRLALKCLFTFKLPYIEPYKENLERLLDPKAFKDELVAFPLSPSQGAIRADHRQGLIPIIIRLLESKITHVKGKTVVLKRRRIQDRGVIYSYFSGLTKEELAIFIQRYVMKPFAKAAHKDLAVFKLDHSRVPSIPEKNIVAFLNKARELVKQLGTSLFPFLDDILAIVADAMKRTMTVAQTVEAMDVDEEQEPKDDDEEAKDSEEDDEDETKSKMEVDDRSATTVKPASGNSQSRKDIRSICLDIILDLFQRYPDYDYKDSFIEPFVECARVGIHNITVSPVKTSLFLNVVCELGKNAPLLFVLCRHPDLTLQVTRLMANRRAPKELVQTVFAFVENIVKHRDEKTKVMTDEAEPTLAELVLKPNVDAFLSIFTSFCSGKNATIAFTKKKGRFTKLGKRLVAIISMLSKYTSSGSAAAVEKLLDIIVPFLRRADPLGEEFLPLMSTINDLLELHPNPIKYFEQFSRAFAFVVTFETRVMLCKFIQELASKDKSIATIAGLIEDLNSYDKRRAGEYDFPRRVAAFRKITGEDKSKKSTDEDDEEETNKQEDQEFGLAASFSARETLPVLCNYLYFLKDEDLAIRENATIGLERYVKVISRKVQSTDITPDEKQKFLEYVKVYMMDTIKHEIRENSLRRHHYLVVLGEIGRSFGPIVPEYSDLAFLAGATKENKVDFFKSISHINIEKRKQAFTALRKLFEVNKFTMANTMEIFVPLVMTFIENVSQSTKINSNKKDLLDDAIETITCISVRMPWEHYHAILNAFLKQLQSNKKRLKTDHAAVSLEKRYVQCACSILNKFPFDLKSQSDESSNKILQAVSRDIIPKLRSFMLDDGAVELEDAQKKSKSKEIPREQISLVLVKLLQVVPEQTRDMYLPSIIIELANRLKHRDQVNRDATRDILVQISSALGPNFLQFILSSLQSALTEGFQLHVLGFTAYMILEKLPAAVGTIDYCLPLILEIALEQMFGQAHDDKKENADAKERRSNKGFVTFEVLGRLINFEKSVEIVLNPLREKLQKTSNPQVIQGVQRALNCLLAGFQKNPCLVNPSAHNEKVLVSFVRNKIQESVQAAQEAEKSKEQAVNNKYSVVKVYENLQAKNYELKPKDAHTGHIDENDKNSALIARNKHNNDHIMNTFYLEVLEVCGYKKLWSKKLQQALKSNDNSGSEIIKLLDPLFPMLHFCLNAKHDKMSIASLQILSHHMLSSKFPSFATYMPKIVDATFELMLNAGITKSNLAQACFDTLEHFVDHPDYKMPQRQVSVLLSFVKSDIIDTNKDNKIKSFELLKTIVFKNYIMEEVYDIMQTIRTHIVSASVTVQKLCAQIMLHFFLNYPMSEEKLNNHLTFLVSNLSFEHADGRLSLIKMLTSLIQKAPRKYINSQFELFFFPIVVQFCNEEEPRCKKELGHGTIFALLMAAEKATIDKAVKFIIKWFSDDKHKMRRVAAQVLSVLVQTWKQSLSTNNDKNSYEKQKAMIETYVAMFLPLLLVNISYDEKEILEEVRGYVADSDNESAIDDNDDDEDDEDDENNNDKKAKKKKEVDIQQLLDEDDDLKNKFLRWEWDVTYFSLVSVDKLLSMGLLAKPDFWKTFEANFLPLVEKHLLHPHAWIRVVSARIFDHYFSMHQQQQQQQQAQNKNKNNNNNKKPTYVSQRAKAVTLANKFTDQLEGKFLNADLANLAVKNLLTLTEVLSGGEQAIKQATGTIMDANYHDDLKSLFTRWNKLHTRSHATELMITSLIKLQAALCVQHLYITKRYLPLILVPIYLIMNDFISVKSEKLKQLANEVFEMLKSAISKEDHNAFMHAYGIARDKVTRKQEKRRMQAAQLAITKPEVAAKIKLAKNKKSRERKKRKRQESRDEDATHVSFVNKLEKKPRK